MALETGNVESVNRIGTTLGFTKEMFESFINSRKDPDWIVQKRKDAWQAYEQIPVPTTNQEIWRRTDIRSLHLGKYNTPDFSKPAEKVDKFDKLSAGIKQAVGTKKDYNAIIITNNGQTIFSEAAPTLPAGVIFEDMETAVHNHRELIEPYLFKGVPVNDSKFAALHSAFWSGGAFLYVPKKTKVELPLGLFTTLSNSGISDFSHLLIVVDELSEVTLIHRLANTDSTTEGFHSGVAELFLKSGAQVRYVDIQDWNYHTWHFSSQRTFIDRDAHLEWIAVGVGAQLAKTDSNTHLRQPGSRVDMLGMIYTCGRQHIDYHTLQDHDAPHASSDLLYNGVLRDKSRTVFRGMIRVHKDAQKTDAYQKNNNLALSGDAHADSIPGLEIQANDVRCTHGSTTGEIDKDQIFYLMSRGISQSEAERLIVEGFYEIVLQRISSEEIQDNLRKVLLNKLALSQK